jgi:hypothetical protein
LFLTTVTSGEATLEHSSTGVLYHCKSDLGNGYVSGPHLLTRVSVTFHECIAINESNEGCTAKSTGATPGSILLNTLKAELGSIKTSEAGSGVGLLFEPETGTELATLEARCTSESRLTGSVAGEVLPVKQAVFTLKVPFNVVRSGLQTIREIAVLGTRKTPSLTAFGGFTSSLKTTELMKIVTTVEVS